METIAFFWQIYENAFQRSWKLTNLSLITWKNAENSVKLTNQRNKSVIKIHHSINESTFWFGAKSVFTNFFRFVDIFCPDFQSVSSVRNPGNAKISTGFYSTWALRKFRRFSIFPYLVHVGAVRHAIRLQTTLSSQTPGGVTLTKRGWGVILGESFLEGGTFSRENPGMKE